MLEKEFKDEKDMLVSSVFKYDSSSGNLNYCGSLCLQVDEMNNWASVPLVGVGYLWSGLMTWCSVLKKKKNIMEERSLITDPANTHSKWMLKEVFSG